MLVFRRAVGALAFAYGAAGVAAAVDTFHFVAPSAYYLDCLAIALYAWALPAAVLAALGLVVASVVRHVPLLRRLCLPTDAALGAHLAALLLSTLSTGSVVLLIVRLGTRSDDTLRFATAVLGFGAMLLVGIALAPTARLVNRGLARLPSALRGPWVFPVSFTLVTLGALQAALFIAPEFMQEVGWEPAVAAGAVLAAAVLGSVASSVFVYPMSIVGGLALGVMVWHATTPTPRVALSAMQNRGAITPTMLRYAAERRDVQRLRTPDEVVACRPGDAVVAAGDIGRAPDDAPDIVLITIDGWRWDHSSMAGEDAHNVTPRIDAHARRAAVYERAYAPAPSTRHSFRSIFSGIYPGRVGAPPTPDHRWSLSMVRGQPTIASYLSAAGYETIALVSKPKIFDEKDHGLQGFDEIDESIAEFHDEHQHSSAFKVSNIIARLARPPEEGEPPRFVWTHLIEPHFPFTHGPELPTSRRLPYHERHLHSLRYVDQQLNRLLQFLAGRERKDDTWVFVTSDHGEAFGDHGARRHGSTIYEEQVHVPLLIWGPGVRPGRKTTPVNIIDLVPTIVAAAGLEPPGSLCGQNLVPSLEEGKEADARPVYTAAIPDDSADYFEVAWIDGDRKLILHGATGRRELYDLAEDPDEVHNLLADDANAGDDLTAALIQFYRDHGMDPRDYRLVD